MTESMSDLLSNFIACVDQLEAAIAGLSDAQLDLRPTGGGWSIRQISHHIVDGDHLWSMFFKQALGKGSSPFALQWYWEFPQDTWASCWAYNERPVEPSIMLLRANREHIIQLLQAIPGSLEGSIQVCWPKGQGQEVTIADVIGQQTRHVTGHVEDICAIRRAYGI